MLVDECCELMGLFRGLFSMVDWKFRAFKGFMGWPGSNIGDDHMTKPLT
jgi:hypothetical protein